MKNKDFWDSRAKLGFQAGTKDLLLKKLEMKAIDSFMRDNISVLDAGCGNGITATWMASNHKIKIVGFDYSEAMIREAHKLSENNGNNVEFLHLDMLNMPEDFLKRRFDLIYTERTLINLDNREKQAKAINILGKMLNQGGLYLMCECNVDGLQRLNFIRRAVGLSEIIQAWHNRYLSDNEIEWGIISGEYGDLKLQKIINHTSTYYFGSRIINAFMAKLLRREPNYNSIINRISARLPAVGNLGYNKLWVWEKI